MELIQKLNLLLSKRDKHFLCVLLFFSMCVSIIETAGVSIIMPFISVASDFKVLESNKYGYGCLIKTCKQVLDKLDLENRTINKITSKERISIRLWDITHTGT